MHALLKLGRSDNYEQNQGAFETEGGAKRPEERRGAGQDEEHREFGCR